MTNPIGEEDAKSLVSHRNRHYFLGKDTKKFFIEQHILKFFVYSLEFFNLAYYLYMYVSEKKTQYGNGETDI